MTRVQFKVLILTKCGLLSNQLLLTNCVRGAATVRDMGCE